MTIFSKYFTKIFIFSKLLPFVQIIQDIFVQKSNKNRAFSARV